MARCHHYHETVLQLLHLNAQIGALFTRDSSGEPLMSSSVKEELAFPNSGKKKPLEDVGSRVGGTGKFEDGSGSGSCTCIYIYIYEYAYVMCTYLQRWAFR
jgi:hypothetical protein